MDDRAFATWTRVLLGALLFASLFGVAHVMGVLVLEQRLSVERSSWLLAGIAFWGYVLVATWIRRNPVAQDR